MTLAFSPPAVATLVETKTAIKPALPNFNKKPWYIGLDRLDVRPVCWSLRNRPEEWAVDTYTITHLPSRHQFWISNGFWFYALYDTNGCSCTKLRRGSFNFWQKIAFGRAYKSWLRWHRANVAIPQANVVHTQFLEHFVR